MPWGPWKFSFWKSIIVSSQPFPHGIHFQIKESPSAHLWTRTPGAGGFTRTWSRVLASQPHEVQLLWTRGLVSLNVPLQVFWPWKWILLYKIKEFTFGVAIYKSEDGLCFWDKTLWCSSICILNSAALFISLVLFATWCPIINLFLLNTAMLVLA